MILKSNILAQLFWVRVSSDVRVKKYKIFPIFLIISDVFRRKKIS